MSQIFNLFPSDCNVHIVQDAKADDLFPEELKLAEKYAEKPKSLFLKGRKAAHLGCQNFKKKQAILRGEKGQPLWPNSLIGSISHTSDRAIAVVAPTKTYDGVGIDIEAIDRTFNLEIMKKIATSKEQEWIQNRPSHLRRELLLKLLSAKEAIFKAFFPLEEVYLFFDDVELEINSTGFKGSLQKKVAKNYDLDYPFQVSQIIYDSFFISAIFLIKQEH